MYGWGEELDGKFRLSSRAEAEANPEIKAQTYS